MREYLKIFYTVVTAVCVFFSSFIIRFSVVIPETENIDFNCLQYPRQAVKTLEEAGLTEKELTERVSATLPEYVQSGGYDDIGGVLISPYYTAKIGEKDIPVYSTLAFLRCKNTGALHSFSEIYVDTDKDFSFNITLTEKSIKLLNAIVLPKSHGVSAICKNGTVTANITKTGIYTFLFNGAKQLYGYTLFVREKFDEDAKIAEYKASFGEDNVMVFEPGVHELDYLNFVNKENQVVYLKHGAYLIAKHHYDINSADDENKYIEEQAVNDNAIGLNRYPFMNFYLSKNIVIDGHGAVDLTRLDRRERRGIVFTYCDNISVGSIKIFNSPEWSFITYSCHNVSVNEVDIFGSRGNSDGFAICNTQNALITNCFARTADDEFEVKALGGFMGSDNITYSDCIAWGGYARCFGICGESSRSITNVTFKDCAVIYRDGVWDNERIGSLVVVAEQCDGSIDGVLFENIEIFRDEGRAILVKVYDEEKENFNIKNVVYKNISYTSYMPSRIDGNKESNTVEVTFENVKANGFTVRHEKPLLSVGDSCNVTFK